jgi:hypothetical protein
MLFHLRLWHAAVPVAVTDSHAGEADIAAQICEQDAIPRLNELLLQRFARLPTMTKSSFFTACESHLQAVCDAKTLLGWHTVRLPSVVLREACSGGSRIAKELLIMSNRHGILACYSEEYLR